MSGTTYHLRSYAYAGYLAGVVVGFGAASFAFLNPYLSLTLLLVGHVLLATALVAAKESP